MATVTSRLDGARPRRRTVLWVGLVLAVESVFVLGYALASNVRPTSLAGVRHWVYPWIWLNVGVWAVLRTDMAGTPARTRRLAGVAALAYFAVLAYAGGLVGHSNAAAGFRLVWATVPPGWGPLLTYAGDQFVVTLIPYRVVGYLALSYLLYATLVDAAGSAVTGLLGMLSCVSCSWPVLASLATGVAGSGSGVAAAVTTGTYGLSTLVFVATVALLYWRPFGDR